MIKYLKEYRFYLILFIFLLIPIISIDTSTRQPRDYRFYDKIIVSMTSPFQTAISWTLDLLSTGVQNYLLLFNTRKENQILMDENRKLLGTIAALRETQQENIRLKRILQFEEKHRLQSLVGRIIAKDVSSEYRAIRINRGASSGIRKNMAVVTHEGIVGRVFRTTAHTADVVTIMDLLSAVDVIDERSRAHGILEGKTEESCQLRYTVRTDDIQPGDILVTSGLGGIFPKGLPVGVVSKAFKRPFGTSQDVEVKPAADFSRIEEVIVITEIEEELVPLAEKATAETPVIVPSPDPPQPVKKVQGASSP